ncbi:MAG: NTP transferase domain-containing protein [Chloroflexi bacterium]|nr:NTP transferase domain-containing protein [Chloroflexota bacterium]
MQAVILAGGLGTRLRPLTEKTCKPMIPVLGKPYLYYQLEMLRQQEHRDILILLGYLGEQVQQYFGDGSSMGLRLEYSFEAKPLGTGGALKNAGKMLKNEFLLLYGDSYLPIKYAQVEQTFARSGIEAMVVVYNNRHDTDVKNNIALDANLYVALYDKDPAAQSGLLNYVEAGVLALRKQVLDYIAPDKVVSLEKEIFPILVASRELKAFVTTQRFYDIGTLMRLKEFEQYLEEARKA